MKRQIKHSFKKLLVVGLVVAGMMFSGVKNCWAQGCLDTGCPYGKVCKEVAPHYYSCEDGTGVSIGGSFKLNKYQTIENATGYSDLGTFVTTSIVPNVMMVANVILFVMILGSGFVIISNAGNADKQKQASQTLTASILGFVIIFAAYWIMQILGIISGFSLLGS